MEKSETEKVNEFDSLVSLKEFFVEFQKLNSYRNAIDAYVSNPKSWTKLGLETKQRDVTRLIERLKRNKIDPEILINYDLTDLENLKNEIKNFKSLLKSITIALTSFTVQPENKKPELSLPQIALLSAYSEIQIGHDNRNEIAFQYGYLAKSSGQNLGDHYEKIRRREQRTIPAGTAKGEHQQVKDLEAIILILDNLKKKNAEDDLKKLKENIERQRYKK